MAAPRGGQALASPIPCWHDRGATTTQICEDANALHGDRAIPGQRHGADLPPPARRGPRLARRVDLRRQLDRAELQPVLPAHGMRRSAHLAGVGAPVAGLRSHIRVRSRRSQLPDPAGRRAPPRSRVTAAARPRGRGRPSPETGDRLNVRAGVGTPELMSVAAARILTAWRAVVRAVLPGATLLLIPHLALSADDAQLERGLRAIQGMAGCYLVDYSYVETESLKPGYVRDS